ncbi:MAG: hypothetical protein K5804_17975 [Microbacterium sp.]|uniref:hypothetical protein n=1 Tax=Microbacterium sp. TaxID=51671 RepID=UPI0026083888|nr:hypothetical protein [Microbacterium sp.]MCV0420134.1 hypothetical protein [Microbacterium sp.]
MSDVLTEWSQSVKLKTVTITTVDFVETKTVVVADILAVVQPADPEKLQVDQIDFSLEYIQIHSVTPMAINQFVEWDGRDFKLVPFRKGYGQYGYTEVVGEETKLPLLVATP